jgi:hypothetical protein
LDKNINIKKNTLVSLDASKKVGTEINAEKTKYMFMSHHQTTGQNHYIKVANKFSENIAKFKYLETTLTNQNCIHKESRSKLNSEKVYYHAVQNLLSPICCLKM